MAFFFADLDPTTRALMLEEFEADVASGRLHKSALAQPGMDAQYEAFHRDAFAHGDADTMTAAIARGGFLKPQNARGATTNIPASSAALGDTQFSAYYARAICRRAIEEGREVEVYRGQDTAEHRRSSDDAIGTHPDPVVLLDELRSFSLEPWNFSLVGKVNSGVTIRLV